MKELGGRPRDLSNCSISELAKLSVKNEDMRQIVGSVGNCLVIATSTGVITVLSSNAIEAGSNLEEVQLVTTKVRVEPRFISVVAWNAMPSTTGLNSTTYYILLINYI